MILNALFMANFRVLRISSKSCYVGDEASLWFSTLLNKPGCKMYQIHEPRDSTKDTKWGNLASPGDKVGSEIVHFCSGLSNCEIQVPTWFLDTSVERVCGKQANKLPERLQVDCYIVGSNGLFLVKHRRWSQQGDSFHGLWLKFWPLTFSLLKENKIVV